MTKHQLPLNSGAQNRLNPGAQFDTSGSGSGRGLAIAVKLAWDAHVELPFSWSVSGGRQFAPGPLRDLSSWPLSIGQLLGISDGVICPEDAGLGGRVASGLY